MRLVGDLKGTCSRLIEDFQETFRRIVGDFKESFSRLVEDLQETSRRLLQDLQDTMTHGPCMYESYIGYTTFLKCTISPSLCIYDKSFVKSYLIAKKQELRAVNLKWNISSINFY